RHAPPPAALLRDAPARGAAPAGRHAAVRGHQPLPDRRVVAAGVIVGLPAYNEAERLPAVLAAVARAAPDAEIAVVDDGSADGTGDLAARCGASVLRHPFNLGYGAALQTLHQEALPSRAGRHA